MRCVSKPLHVMVHSALTQRIDFVQQSDTCVVSVVVEQYILPEPQRLVNKQGLLG